MAESDEKLSRRGYTQQEEPEMYPLPVRVYGVLGIVAWQYTSIGNIDGRTSILFMIGWGFLGLLWVRFVTPWLLKVVNKIPWNWRYAVTTVCTVLMLANCVLTLAALDCWYQRNAGIMDFEHPTAIEAFCNENYDDEFMENRFQSMKMHPENAARSNSS